MTKAEVRSSVRALINEASTDAGALFPADNVLLDELLDDALEQVVMDLIPICPHEFLYAENITLIANQNNYTLTAEYWQIFKVEKTVTNESPTEIEVIDPLDRNFEEYVGQTDAEPWAYYKVGTTLYFVPTPAAAKTNYCRAILIRPEAVTWPAGGLAYIPRPAQRLVAYKACANAATLLEDHIGTQSVMAFDKLYGQRLQAFERVWRDFFKSKPRFVRDSVNDRTTMRRREKAFYDPNWS